MPSPFHTRIDSLLVWIAASIAALPCFYLSSVLFNVWREPMAWDDGNWVRLGVGLLVLEFVLLHSGAFMVGMLGKYVKAEKKITVATTLIAFYTLLVWGFSISLDSPELLWIFLSLVLGRGVSMLFDAEASKQAIMARSALGVVLYMLVAGGTIFLPIPELGISTEVLNAVYPGRGSGLWEAEPERAIAGAAAYFLLMGIAEMTVLRPSSIEKKKENRSD